MVQAGNRVSPKYKHDSQSLFVGSGGTRSRGGRRCAEEDQVPGVTEKLARGVRLADVSRSVTPSVTNNARGGITIQRSESMGGAFESIPDPDALLGGI